MVGNKIENEKKKSARRRLVKTIAVGGTVGVSQFVPHKWSSPVVKSLTLPAHAATSGCEIFACSGGYDITDGETSFGLCFLLFFPEGDDSNCDCYVSIGGDDFSCTGSEVEDNVIFLCAGATEVLGLNGEAAIIIECDGEEICRQDLNSIPDSTTASGILCDEDPD